MKEFESIKDVNKFLIQCHRIGTPLNCLQIAMLLTLYDHGQPLTLGSLSIKLKIKKAMVNRHLKPLFDRSGKSFVIQKGWEHLELSELGKLKCESLITNARHFWRV